MEIKGPKDLVYAVEKEIGGTERFSLYQCRLPDGQPGILKIARAVGNNGLLDREAFLLNLLKTEAARVETEYAAVSGGKSAMNYQFYFPSVTESFVCPEQGNRRISILSFLEISPELVNLVPLGHIASRDFVRVDPRTSAWMLGKLLKLLVFTHSIGISIKQIDGDNVVAERDEHYIAVFDWTNSEIYSNGTVPSDVAGQEVVRACQLVISAALGGDPVSGAIPPDEQDKNGRYADVLCQLVNGHYDSAATAHREFYKVVRDLWSRGFWKYRTYPL